VIDEATRIRVVRALLGITSKELASRLEVTQGVITAWEKGRSTPRRMNRATLAQMCQKANIMFLPSGMPVPAEDLMPQETITNG
jgi:DNA-binding transcriptional regulator YiaG